MSELNPMSGETLDLTKENIKKLKELFPEVLTEDQIDFEKLRLILGDEVNDNPEKYSFTWNGKNDAIKLAQQSSTGTLRPKKEKSKNWDTTENLYIEGDNLEVLKQLQKSYTEKIKVIYIDPPYNTGKDFIYKDDFKDNIQNYFEQTGQVDSEGHKLSTKSETSGRFHTEWLNMMYPRLILAKSLLKDDGVILISIDNKEQENLKKICNEIFGEENFIETIIWDKKTAAKGVPPQNMMVNVHEYIIAYQKSDVFKFSGELRTVDDGFKNPDNDPRGPWRQSNIKSTIKPMSEAFTITDPNTGKEYTNTWAFSKESLESMIQEGRILWKETLPKQKEFLYEMTNTNKAIKSNWGVFDPQSTTVHLKKIVPEVQFDNPKPLNLMQYLINVSTEKNDLIMDFFSGSATTAEAVMRLNANDNGKRKFLIVQLPEPLDDKYKDSKGRFNNIAEVAQERIRRAGEKILEDNQLLPNELDIGFKVFELDNSNIQKWNVDSENLEESLFAMQNNFIEGRSHADVVYEVLLKLGLDLNTPFEENTVDGSTVYDVAFGNVYIVLGENITQEVANYIADKQKDYDNENPSVVFNDNGFANDNEKLNSIEILKNNGFNEEQLMSI